MGGNWEKAFVNRHPGGHLVRGIWEDTSEERHLGGLRDRLWEGSGGALGKLWKNCESFGGSGGSKNVWDGFSPQSDTTSQPLRKHFFCSFHTGEYFAGAPVARCDSKPG